MSKTGVITYVSKMVCEYCVANAMCVHVMLCYFHVGGRRLIRCDLTRLNKIATKIMNSRWQVDKEAVWLVESPTYLSKYTPPVLCICRFYF